MAQRLSDATQAAIASAPPERSNAELARQLGVSWSIVAYHRQQMAKHGGWVCKLRWRICPICGQALASAPSNGGRRTHRKCQVERRRQQDRDRRRIARQRRRELAAPTLELELSDQLHALGRPPPAHTAYLLRGAVRRAAPDEPLPGLVWHARVAGAGYVRVHVDRVQADYTDGTRRELYLLTYVIEGATPRRFLYASLDGLLADSPFFRGPARETPRA